MKYFIDFEFEEKEYKNGIAIEVISIGITNEKNENLYLVNKDYDIEKCQNEWLKENVFQYLETKRKDLFCSKYFVSFVDFKNIVLDYFEKTSDGKIELYGYFSAYDHVCLSSLFGRMVNLPESVPMYTKDLKQYCDDLFLSKEVIKEECQNELNEHCSIDDAIWNKKLHSFLQSISSDFLNI